MFRATLCLSSGEHDARNLLRQKFDNKHQISCILFVSLPSPYVHDARSQEPKIYTIVISVSTSLKMQDLLDMMTFDLVNSEFQSCLLLCLQGSVCPRREDCLDQEDGGSKLFQHNKIMLNLQQATALDLPLQIISFQCQFSNSES